MKVLTQRILCILVALFGTCMSLYAQNGTISGIVLDADLKEPALAYITAGDQTVATDAISGQYTLSLAPGDYSIAFYGMSYDTLRQDVTIESGKTLTLNVELKEKINSLIEVEIISDRFSKPVGEAITSIDVISPKLIENTNAVSVDQAIAKVPGVTIMSDQVDIRGGAGYAQGTGSRVLLLMDDMPILQADAGLAHWRDIPTENLSQIEVLKGAASTLYGSGALNGVINMRTAYPTAKPYTKISVFGTWYGAPKDSTNKWWDASNAPYETGLQFAHRQKIGKKLDLVVGSNLFWDSGFRRGVVTDTAGVTDTIPGYNRKGRINVITRYRIKENLILGLSANVNVGMQNQYLFWIRNRSAALPSLYDTDPSTTPIKGRNFRITLDPSITYFDTNGNRFKFQMRYYRIINVMEYNQSNRSNHVYSEAQYQREFKDLGGLKLAAGLVGSFTAVDAEVYGGEKFSIGNFASYLQLDKKFFDRLSLSMGIRMELNDMNSPDSISLAGYPIASPNNFEGKPIFRFGANYKMTAGTFFRASFGQGYRYPTLLEKFISTSSGILGVYPNPELRSETGWSAEVGIKQGFKISKWQGFLDVAGFWTEYQDMMEFTFVPNYFGFQVLNAGDTRITGIDIGLAGQGKIGAFSTDIMAGYTYINPMYRNFEDSLTRETILSGSTSDENVLKYRYRHTIKFDGQTTYTFKKNKEEFADQNISVGFSVQYMSFMEAMDEFVYMNFPTIQEFRDSHNTGVWLMSARLGFNFTKFAKVSVLANNLLNAEYSMRPGLLEAPRNFTVRADFTF